MSEPKLDFHAAVKTRDDVRTILEAAGVKATYAIRLTDTGPCVDITVANVDYAAAQDALPFTIGRATVQLLKAVPSSRKRPHS